MNRRIDFVSEADRDKGIVMVDKSAEFVDESRLDRIRRIFSTAVESLMKGNIEGLRQGIAELEDEILGFFKRSPSEEEVEAELVDAKVDAYKAKEGLIEAQKKLSYLESRNKELEAMAERALAGEEEAQKCGLTGFFYKKYFLRKMRERLGPLRRESHSSPVPVSLAFFDVDKFKRVNDTYGHDVGDEVIKKIGEVVRARFQRGDDIMGKFGGDEFLILLPKCDEDNAQRLLEELRSEIEGLEFEGVENGEKKKFKVTISIGVLTVILHRLNYDEDLVELVMKVVKGADEQLYESKNGGKNMVTAKQIDIGEMPDEEGAIV